MKTTIRMSEPGKWIVKCGELTCAEHCHDLRRDELTAGLRHAKSAYDTACRSYNVVRACKLAVSVANETKTEIKLWIIGIAQDWGSLCDETDARKVDMDSAKKTLVQFADCAKGYTSGRVDIMGELERLLDNIRKCGITLPVPDGIATTVVTNCDIIDTPEGETAYSHIVNYLNASAEYRKASNAERAKAKAVEAELGYMRTLVTKE